MCATYSGSGPFPERTAQRAQTAFSLPVGLGGEPVEHILPQRSEKGKRKPKTAPLPFAQKMIHYSLFMIHCTYPLCLCTSFQEMVWEAASRPSSRSSSRVAAMPPILPTSWAREVMGTGQRSL